MLALVGGGDSSYHSIRRGTGSRSGTSCRARPEGGTASEKKQQNLSGVNAVPLTVRYASAQKTYLLCEQPVRPHTSTAENTNSTART